MDVVRCRAKGQDLYVVKAATMKWKHMMSLEMLISTTRRRWNIKRLSFFVELIAQLQCLR